MSETWLHSIFLGRGGGGWVRGNSATRIVPLTWNTGAVECARNKQQKSVVSGEQKPQGRFCRPSPRGSCEWLWADNAVGIRPDLLWFTQGLKGSWVGGCWFAKMYSWPWASEVSAQRNPCMLGLPCTRAGRRGKQACKLTTWDVLRGNRSFLLWIALSFFFTTGQSR